MLDEVKKALKDVVGRDVTVISHPISGGTAVFIDTKAGLVHVAAGHLRGESEEPPKPTARFAYDANKKRGMEPILLPIEK